MKNNTHSLLSNLFDHILSQTEKLEATLRLESNALKQRTVLSLTALSEDKFRLVTELNKLANLQVDFLKHQNLAPGKEGIEQYLSDLEKTGHETQELKHSWSQIVETTENCRTLNEANAACVELLNQHVQRSIDILRGQSESTRTYGPDGINQTPISSQSLASA